MATSDNPCIPIPSPHIDGPEEHHHEVPTVNIKDEDRRTLEDDYGEPALDQDGESKDEPEDEVPEEDPDDEPLAREDSGIFGTTK